MAVPFQFSPLARGLGVFCENCPYASCSNNKAMITIVIADTARHCAIIGAHSLSRKLSNLGLMPRHDCKYPSFRDLSYICLQHGGIIDLPFLRARQTDLFISGNK